MQRHALLASFLAACAAPALAQTPQTDASRKATAELKVFTDQLQLKAPPPLYEGKPGYEDFNDFRTSFWNDYTGHRKLYLWDEEAGPADGLSPERFQLAYARASDRGRDPAKGMRWTCELVAKLRGYFMFYSQASGRDDAGLKLLGTQALRVQMMDEVVHAVADRYKEASGIDARRALKYNLKSECESAGEQIVQEQTKGRTETRLPPPSVVDVHPNPTPWERPDSTKWRYFVLFYDATWQPWEMVARSKGWKADDATLERFVLRRAPEWVSGFVARAPRSDQSAVSRTWKSGPPGEVLRHELQPKSARERDHKLIAEHREKYKLK